MNPPQCFSLLVMSFHIFFHIPFSGESVVNKERVYADLTDNFQLLLGSNIFCIFHSYIALKILL